MKVRKIDIKETLLDLPPNKPMYYEAEYDPEVFLKIRNVEENIPDTVTVKQHAYEIRLLRKKKPNSLLDYTEDAYAVKLDSRGIFDDIVQIGDDILSEKMNKSREDGFWKGESKGYYRGAEVVRKEIRELSLWKRITKQF